MQQLPDQITPSLCWGGYGKEFIHFFTGAAFPVGNSPISLSEEVLQAFIALLSGGGFTIRKSSTSLPEKAPVENSSTSLPEEAPH